MKPLKPEKIPFDTHPNIFSTFGVWFFSSIPRGTVGVDKRALARHWISDEDLFPSLKRQMIVIFLGNMPVYLEATGFGCEVV